MELWMKALHRSLDVLTLTCGLYCYHPYGNNCTCFLQYNCSGLCCKHTSYTVKYTYVPLWPEVTDELTSIDTDNMRTTLPITVGHISDDNPCVSISCNCLMQYAIYTSC